MARDFPIALVSLWVPPPPGIVPDHGLGDYDDHDDYDDRDDHDDHDDYDDDGQPLGFPSTGDRS